MKITEQFRDQILIVMPELSADDAGKVAAVEQCTRTTVYNHWKKLKELEGDVSTIHLCLAEVAISKKKHFDKEQRRIQKIHKQLSAA